MRASWPAPAKINLFLHVVGKRSDGYHELETAFQFLSYGDELTFDINQTGVISRSYDLGFPEDTDLCLRAAHLLAMHTDETVGVEIGLIKRLPMGGGLGGGSSNAATVLLALNELWGVGLERRVLAELGLELGADVPVFIMGTSAWAEGVGERLTPICAPEPWFVVLNPNIEVSTAEIFSNKRLTDVGHMKKIRALEKGIDFNGRHSCIEERVIDSTFGINQLESIVCAEYPEVNDLLEWLSQFGAPRMTGSGGSVFLAVNSQNKAEQILEERPLNSAGFVAKGENFHPLFKEME